MSLASIEFPPSRAGTGSQALVSGLILALAATFLFALAAFAPAVLGDGDTWSHVARMATMTGITMVSMC